ncbi:MAG: helicase-associated domain-containing protein, partial [Chloroflexia bacterium]
ALIEAGGSAPTRDLGKSAGLPPSVLREAVSDLNDRLLALEDYRDGWRLFAPLGPRHHLPGAGGPTNTPEPTIAPAGHTAAPEWAGAWDLLNLLRALEIYEVPEEPSGRLPGAFRSRFETSLASRPSDPGAAINYLYADARRLGLVQNSGSAVKPSARAGSWVAAGLAEQTRRLLAAWTEHGAAGETESLAKSAGFREDADLMQAARRALLAALAACEPGVWYTIAGLVEVVRAASPNILRPQNRLVRDLGSSGARAALENWVEVEGRDPPRDHRPTELAPRCRGRGGRPTDRRSGRLDACARGRVADRQVATPASPDAQPRIAATPEGRVRISAPDSATIWMLAGFARPVRAGRRPGYLIDRRTVARARGIGVGPDEIVSFLRRHSESAIPTRLVELIQEWGREPHRVVLRPAIVVRCETEAGLEELVASPIVRSYSPVRLGDDTVVLTLSEGSDYEELDAMLRRLTKSGLFSAERYSGR